MKFFIAKWKFGYLLALYTKKGLQTTLLDTCATSLIEKANQAFPTAQQAFSNDSMYQTMQQLIHYANTLQAPYTGPLDIDGTSFQKKVWKALSSIPFGEVMTYSQIATTINKPNAYRAVANACGQNPMPLVIPCHRAVGINSITGYKFGATLKQALLESEKL